MRVAFIGKSHPFSMRPLEALAAEHSVVGVIESAPRGARTITRRLRRAASGIIHFRNDRVIRTRARTLGARYLWLDKSTLPDLAVLLRQLETDVICVASLSLLLPLEIIGIPRYGAINLHPSKLPRYHGPMPWLWQYLDFLPAIGITVHHIDAGQDTGAILKQTEMPIPVGTDVSEAMAMAGTAGGQLMVATLHELASGTARPAMQNPAAYPKARVVKREEQLIDWSGWPIEQVWHAMRGTYPWLDPPSCPLKLRGHYRVGGYEPCNMEESAGTVGRDEHGYYVAHRNGKIRIYAR